MDANEIEVKFLSKIRKNNDPKFISGKVFLIFGFVLAVSLILGIGFFKISGEAISDAMKMQIASHFSDIFKGCRNPTDYFAVIITASSADFRYLVLIFAAGFTYFCKYASFAFIGIRGFTVGYSLGFLGMAIKEEFIRLKHPIITFSVFVFAETVLLALITYLSVKATLFGDDFRRLRGRKSLILRSPIIYRYIFLFLTAFGLVIIINAGYCSISSILQ